LLSLEPTTMYPASVSMAQVEWGWLVGRSSSHSTSPVTASTPNIDPLGS
jgi:hypothetical protein